MAKELFNRYIWLTDTIYKAGRITFAEINRKWKQSSHSDGNEIALRTFHNHRNAIEEIFGILISCDGRTNEYYIENAQEIGKNTLIHWLLNSISISNMIRNSASIQDRIILENIPSAQKFLGDIVDAMRENRVLQVFYLPFDKDAALEIELQPYFVKLFNRRWYIFGCSLDSEVVKVYALDRIEKLVITDRLFSLPADFSPDNHLYDSYGIIRITAIKPIDIVIKAFGNHPKYLRSLPLHHSQTELETSADYSLFKYRLAPTYDFYQDIFSRREQVEIVSPSEVRDEFKRILTQISKSYGC
ncbi:MAG: WYL domain-containing protein [Ignavibacteria bacterium]|nr:WYL domain-containing protein [Ignavibacteria bacterium]